MQKELDEILKSITGKSLNSSSANLSKPKQFAIKLIDAFDSMASANAKTNFTQSVWKSIKWYMKNKIIPQKSDKETIADLRKMKETIEKHGKDAVAMYNSALERIKSSSLC